MVSQLALCKESSDELKKEIDSVRVGWSTKTPQTNGEM
jgi:hypothetical protein